MRDGVITEADTCREFVTPRLVEAGWGAAPHVIGEQRSFTNGRIIVAGGKVRRGKHKRADYLLYYRRDYGRVLLASRLIALFRVDRQWTEQCLLPRFDWAADPMEAKAAWEGVLWSPRLYRPLLLAFKPQFLETAWHYGDLGEHGRQFAAFLTYAALGPVDGYTAQEWRTASKARPLAGFDSLAEARSWAGFCGMTRCVVTV